MPKRVRPYGSAEDAEAAGLGSRLRTGGEGASEPGSTMTMRDTAGQATREGLPRKAARDATKTAESTRQAARKGLPRKAAAAAERAGGGHQQVSSPGKDIVHQPAQGAEQ